jgi:DNA mismatch endonuclease (patch repair protein)
MQRQRRRDTEAELALRSLLHRRGLRYRVHFPLPRLRRRADIAFPRAKVAIFVDGCFWHGCPQHGTWPKANAEWWRDKIQRNVERDRDTDERLRMLGWTVIRIWEHDPASDAAGEIERVVRSRTEEETPLSARIKCVEPTIRSKEAGLPPDRTSSP